MRRFYVLGYLLVLIALNEWAFLLIFPLQPVDEFMRLMVVVLDLLLLPAIVVGFTKGGFEKVFRGTTKCRTLDRFIVCISTSSL